MSNVIIAILKVNKGQGWNKVWNALEEEFGVDASMRQCHEEQYRMIRVEMSGHAYPVFESIVRDNKKCAEELRHAWHCPETLDSHPGYALISEMFYNM